MQTKLVLASGSPRRQALMKMLGLPFLVRAADIDEWMDSSLPLEREVARISATKAHAVAQPGETVISADTIVVIDGRILGKPKDDHEAVRMLETLSGRAHTVMTGLTVLRDGREETALEQTDVRFRPLRAAEIRAYVKTGEPLDKAGAYGIQNQAAIFVEGIVGDYYNVMGFPLCRLSELLRKFDITIL